ncbi:hypothetical protein GGI17_004234 [Coemansia sp. S146]|nr:hypothetical protein GGI17_004234 [Coemansia sp. S146]
MFTLYWDVLVGKLTLDNLGGHLMTPAIIRCVEGTQNIAGHPEKLFDSPRHIEVADYKQLPNTAPIHDLSIASSLKFNVVSNPVKEPVISRPMRDPDFANLGSLYLETTVKSTESHTKQQCPDAVTTPKPMPGLVTGKTAMG